MANPKKYTPGFSYTGFESHSPKRPKPGPELDDDFAKIERSVGETIDALKDIRREDGKLVNGIVTPESLSPDVKATLTGDITELVEEAIEARDEAVEAAEKLNDAVSLRYRDVLTNAGQQLYEFDTDGNALDLNKFGGAQIYMAPLGLLRPFTNYEINDDGSLSLLFSPPAGSLVQIVETPRVPNSEAQGILQDIEVYTRENAERAEEAADRAEDASNKAPQSWEDFQDAKFLALQDGVVVQFNDVLFVRARSSTSTEPPTGPGWEPFGAVRLGHFAEVTSLLDAGPVLQAAGRWAMGNGRRLTVREELLVSTPVYLPYSGHLDFDFKGARITAGVGWVTGNQMIKVEGLAPSGEGSFNWIGGHYNGENMAAGSLNSNNLIDISVGNSCDVVRIDLEGTYTGPNFFVAGGDTHVMVNCSRLDLNIGRAQGATDLAVYHTSSSNKNSARHEDVKIRGTFVGCRRAASTKRNSALVDIDITVIDCFAGCHLQRAEFSDLTVPTFSARGGTVKVRATRTQHAVLDDNATGIVYDVVQTDVGYYFPAAEAGGIDQASASGRCELRGAVKNTGRIVTTGINPAIPTPTATSFCSVWLGDGGGVSSADNTFDVISYGVGRLMQESGAAPARNRIKFQADISNSIIAGIGSRSDVMFPNVPTVTGSRGGNAALASLLSGLNSAGVIVNNSVD